MMLAKSWLGSGAVALLCGLLASSVLADPAPIDGAVSYKTQIQPIFNAQCVFCHVTGAENGGLNLGRSASFANLVGTPSTESKLLRVAPAKPEDSYLIHKLQGDQANVGGNGDRMPRTDPPRPLDPAQLELIKTWIRAGAQNN